MKIFKAIFVFVFSIAAIISALAISPFLIWFYIENRKKEKQYLNNVNN